MTPGEIFDRVNSACDWTPEEIRDKIRAVRATIPGKMHMLAGQHSDKIAAFVKSLTGVAIGGRCGFGTPYYVCHKQLVAAGVPKGSPCEVGTAKGACSPLCSKHNCDRELRVNPEL